jgi:hypothetical protein
MVHSFFNTNSNINYSNNGSTLYQYCSKYINSNIYSHIYPTHYLSSPHYNNFTNILVCSYSFNNSINNSSNFSSTLFRICSINIITNNSLSSSNQHLVSINCLGSSIYSSSSKHNPPSIFDSSLCSICSNHCLTSSLLNSFTHSINPIKLTLVDSNPHFSHCSMDSNSNSNNFT